MQRRGLSITMGYVVIGLIALTTAFTVLLYFTDNLNIIGGITETELTESEKQLAKSHCEREMPSLCQQDGISGTQWADDATYDGRTCADWEGEGLWGDSGLPECPE